MNNAIGFVAGGETDLQKITRYRDNAQTSYRNSKDSAMETIGQLYLLWKTLVSPLASDMGRQAYRDEVGPINDAITQHNDAISAILTKVKNSKIGKFDPAREFATEGKSEEDAYQIKKDEAEFYAYAALDAKEGYYRKKVKINIDNADFEFTSLVRFGLNLLEGIYNDVVSRYATVLKYVAKRLELDLATEASQVVDFLKSEGGFEAVLRRAQDEKELGPDQSENEVIESDANEFARQAVREMTSKSVIQEDSKYAHDGYVLMVGRVHAGVTEVLGDVPMTENEVKKAVLHLGNEAQIPDNDNSEFFARVMKLSRLIREGQASGTTKDGTQSGEVFKPEKSMVIRKAEDGQPHLVISNRYGESSVVLHARPKAWEDFATIEEDVIFPPDNVKRLEKDLSTLAKRRRIDYSFVNKPLAKDGTPAKSPVSLEACYAALVDNGWDDPIKQYYWNKVVDQRHKPLDIDHFAPQFVTEIDQTDAAQILAGPYHDWLTTQAGNKAKATTSFIFEGDKLIVKVTKKLDHEIVLSHPVEGSFTLTFNQKDIYDLMSLIEEQKAAKYQLRGDEGGLMAISWEDKLGFYTIHLPTVVKNGSLETRRVSTMRFNAMAKAAE